MLSDSNVYDRARLCADQVLAQVKARPRVGIILGTGLGGLGQRIQVEQSFPYETLPDFPLSTVESHTGKLIVGHLAGVPVVAMSGRFHSYEGYAGLEVTFPVRVMKLMGACVLLVSNAAGGLNPNYRKGDVMVLTDHINLLGGNPLIGANDARFGPRFPDMSCPYSPRLTDLASKVATDEKIRIQAGVYVAVGGPNLETRAEYRALRVMGADCVGMSTVPEVIVARHMNMECFAASVVTDMCLPDALEEAKLEDILAVAGEAEPRLTRLLEGMVASLGADLTQEAKSR